MVAILSVVYVPLVQVEVLQAEVVALKSLVITSTPSMPNRHLHPQIDVELPNPKVPFVKGHRRSTSHHSFSKEKHQKTAEVAATVPAVAQPPVTQEDREVGIVEAQKITAVLIKKYKRIISLFPSNMWN